MADTVIIPIFADEKLLSQLPKVILFTCSFNYHWAVSVEQQQGHHTGHVCLTFEGQRKTVRWEIQVNILIQYSEHHYIACVENEKAFLSSEMLQFCTPKSFISVLRSKNDKPYYVIRDW